MAETSVRPVTVAPGSALPIRGAKIDIPLASASIQNMPPPSQAQLAVPITSPVNQNGSFEFDRVIKAGYVQRRTQKTKAWKTVYLVLRPNTLSIYKSDSESKLRHKIYLTDLSAVTMLRDPKQKRQNLFGLYSPAKNYHFEARTAADAQEWIDLIRQDARIEEEEEEMFLASPIVRRQSFAPTSMLAGGSENTPPQRPEFDRFASSSPEPLEARRPNLAPHSARRASHPLEPSGMSGTEMASHSDFSDAEAQRMFGASAENLAVGSFSTSGIRLDPGSLNRPVLGNRNLSQVSGLNGDQDPDRVVWQGWLWFLKGKRGVRQWKDCWAVLRPRNLILYKDESEYTAYFILPLSVIVNTVDIDPVSKTKTHCMQIITDEKSYRLCAHEEESLVQCLGAFKSILNKRKELEARAAATAATSAAPTT
ncbi:PH domain-containing protein [Microdochium trichocladiopsis]|uniref:PH domain-containing protein n=1 Tax=Microdochium trichocladiopsis TaxID=1682393 RepID=A0A9P8YJE8_9PEZI|nr:PH domain-containing protein [Microdochium trichocladiopsis]KAH7040998.1 PH domain-containing protein [Microdochium trichocladiopsis]